MVVLRNEVEGDENKSPTDLRNSGFQDGTVRLAS